MTQPEIFTNSRLLHDKRDNSTRPTLCVYEDFVPAARRIRDELEILRAQVPGIIVPPGPRLYRTAIMRPRKRICSDAKLANKLGGYDIQVTRRRRGRNPPQIRMYSGLEPSPAVRLICWGNSLTSPKEICAMAKQCIIPTGVPVAYPLRTLCRYIRRDFVWKQEFTKGHSEEACSQNAAAATALVEPNSRCFVTGPDSDFKQFLQALQGVTSDQLISPVIEEYTGYDPQLPWTYPDYRNTSLGYDPEEWEEIDDESEQ